ncbi:MAG: HAD-IIA family hydrolase [Kurthia sp.]|nr:HAD-IIA family hydrolase [Candidatus Kurthia equi]
MKAYSAYCFDLDGTVYIGEKIIPKAKQAIEDLRAKGIKPFYVTNNAKMTQQQIYNKLSKLGIELEPNHIMTSAIATAKYVKKFFPNQTVFMIGQDGLREALEAEAIEIVEDQADLVVQGIDFELNYKRIELAGYQLQNGAKLIATNGDIKVPKERGFAPGNGSLVHLLATVSNVEPLFIGKPEPYMLAALQDEFQLEKQQMLMIGDNFDTDIMAGVNFGIDTCHVNTGVTPATMLRLKEKQPTYFIEEMDELLL